MAIDSVQKKEESTQITFLNKGDIPMPIVFEVTYDDDTKEMRKLPVEIWQRSLQLVHMLKSTKEIVKIQIDPQGFLPDVNLRNNVWVKQ